MSQFFKIKDNEGFFEAEIPFNYSDNNNVIGWLYNADRECICNTTMPETKLIGIPSVNYYINKYQPIIDACKSKSDYEAAYMRISTNIAGIISGRGFNQELETYLQQYPTRREFYNWWMGIKDSIHSKAF